MFPSQTADKFVVRLPEGMRDRIRQQAKANQRTMNSEIVYHLDRALAEMKARGPVSVAALPGHDHDNSPTTEKANELDEQ